MERGPGHVTDHEISGPLTISGVVEAMDLKFGT